LVCQFMHQGSSKQHERATTEASTYQVLEGGVHLV